MSVISDSQISSGTIPVPPAKLADFFRHKLEQGPVGHWVDDTPGKKRASVLVPLHLCSDQACLIYIKRSRAFDANGREAVHSGQLAFPGGKIEPGEHSSLTALRETEEEIALPREHVRMLGFLTRVNTLTSHFNTDAYIGWIDELPALHANAAEVAAIYHVPLPDLMRQHDPQVDLTLLQHRLALHYHWRDSETGEPICIWGMTARITWFLLEMLRTASH